MEYKYAQMVANYLLEWSTNFSFCSTDALWVKMRSALVAGTAGLLLGGQMAAASLDSYIAKESVRSYQGIIDNLGNKGVKAPGTAAGLFIASPNTANPDCELQGIMHDNEDPFWY